MLEWIRPRFPATTRGPVRRARLLFLALLKTPRIDDALEATRALCSEAAWDELEVTVKARAGDGGRLDGALAGRAGHGLDGLDAATRHEITTCPRYAAIEADLPDPRSLRALQAAIELGRQLAEADDLVAWLDGVTARWWLPAELLALAPDRPFHLDEHVQVVVEAVERRPGHGHVVRSRGLCKVARPDVCARAPRREASLVSEVVRDVARLLAEGIEVEPGDRLTVRDLPPLTLMPRSEGALAEAAPESAPLYELCDVTPDGITPGCPALLAALKPRPTLKVLR